MYKLVVTDLDGTFLDDGSRIPPKNRDAVKLMDEKGVAFCLASGRSYHSLEYFYDELSLIGRGICGIAFNGAIVYEVDTRRRLRTAALSNKLMRRIVRESRPLTQDVYVYDIDGVLYSEYETEIYRGYYTRSGLPKGIRDLDEIDNDVIKVLLMGDHGMLSDAYARLEGVIRGECNMIFSSRRMLEFTGRDATKGCALKFLGEHLSIDISEIIAVGDNYNDESMILNAGLGIVTANAEESLKAKASYVTRATNNDGALMEIVETFL